MAKDIITRFKLETTQYDSKLRDAAKELTNFTKTATQAGKGFNEFTRGQVEAARALGNTASGATNLKDKLKDTVTAFNSVAKAYNQLTDAQKQSDFGRAMSESLNKLQQTIRETKQQLQGMGSALPQGGGGLFGGGKLDGMLQVFGGNLMTKGAGMLAGLASEMGDMIKQGIELAKQGEGIRIAFERLGRGDLLDGLRQATHGTVTDLELMKAAVKFNDFKLPVEELGTMLAFAQQKAKDTGQSVDYMVDSIVTGLGRKSLMILDNLGLSAAEIKERMAETGDMTKAVGAIIRDQMAKAGDYVETAADRATQANVQLENAMTRLGETFQPLTDTANSMWTSIKIGALDLLNNAVKPLIKALQEAGALGQKARGNAGYENLGGDAKINRLIANLGDGKSPKAYRTYKAQMAEFDRYANSLKFKIAAFGDDKSGVAQSAVAKLQTELAGVLTMRMEYDRRAQELHKKATAKNIEANKEEEQSIDSLKKKLAELQEQRKKAIAAGDTDLSKSLLKQINQVKADIKGLGGSTTTTTTKQTTAEKIVFDENKAAISATRAVDTMPSVWKMLDTKGLNPAMGSIMPDLSGDISQQTSMVDELRAKWAEATGELRDGYMAQLIAAEEKLRTLKEEGDVSTGNGTKPTDPNKDISREWRVNRKGQLVQGKSDKDEKEVDLMTKTNQVLSNMSSSVNNVFSSMEKLGIEIPQGLRDVIGVLDVISGICSAIQGAQTVGNILGLFSGGGIAHAANGWIGGNHMSGDQIPIMVNSGELILNKAQQGNLASQIQGGGLQGLYLEASVHAEQIRLALNNNGKRTGRGELVTWKRS